jgi:predicted RNA binding protein YcfA (HicA-like mRNA interferase family)
MPKLPRTSGKEIVRTLNRFGFYVVRQKGSHLILKKENYGNITGCVVPSHSEVAIGILRSILR